MSNHIAARPLFVPGRHGWTVFCIILGISHFLWTEIYGFEGCRGSKTCCFKWLIILDGKGSLLPEKTPQPLLMNYLENSFMISVINYKFAITGCNLRS